MTSYSTTNYQLHEFINYLLFIIVARCHQFSNSNFINTLSPSSIFKFYSHRIQTTGHQNYKYNLMNSVGADNFKFYLLNHVIV